MKISKFLIRIFRNIRGMQFYCSQTFNINVLVLNSSKSYFIQCGCTLVFFFCFFARNLLYFLHRTICRNFFKRKRPSFSKKSVKNLLDFLVTLNLHFLVSKFNAFWNGTSYCRNHSVIEKTPQKTFSISFHATVT